MLRKCHGHGLTKGAIIQIFYHGLEEPTQGILDITDGSDSNTDNYRFMEKLKAMDSQIISLNEELQDIRNKYNEHREENTSKNHLNDDKPMCELHEANNIQSEDNKDRNSHDSHSHQSHHDPNDPEKSLTELNDDVKNDLEDFNRRIRSMRTVHWKFFARDDGKTTGVLPNKESKTQNEKNFQTIFKNMERKIDEWEKSQNISLEQTDRTVPPPPSQAHTKQVNAVFTESGKSDDSPKI
ncbi:hypothetical protein Tco_1174106 [Tanacetum coccineum]